MVLVGIGEPSQTKPSQAKQGQAKPGLRVVVGGGITNPAAAVAGFAAGGWMGLGGGQALLLPPKAFYVVKVWVRVRIRGRKRVGGGG
jgi:hypothetical protein